MSFNRRQFLWSGVLLGLASTKHGYSQAEPSFSEVPPSASGISWVHENAMSTNRYLPETLGPGCAFLDFDNDGWMDVYLVNSGACDFWKPVKPVRNALYKN